jgi:hypothetical protein
LVALAETHVFVALLQHWDQQVVDLNGVLVELGHVQPLDSFGQLIDQVSFRENSRVGNLFFSLQIKCVSTSVQ